MRGVLPGLELAGFYGGPRKSKTLIPKHPSRAAKAAECKGLTFKF